MAQPRLLLALLAASFIAGPAAAQINSAADCADTRPPYLDLPNGQPVDVERALALVRFHRQQEALEEVDAARTIVRGPWRFRLPSDRRDAFIAQLEKFRTCLATTAPAGLAPLTVRVIGDPPGQPQPVMLLEGARVYVEGLLVGRTDGNGTLTVSVPSGPIRVEAEVPINQWGEAEISLSPGQSGTLEITLDDDKEVEEHTTLVLAEALDDIIPATTRSMTLKFTRDGRLTPVTAIEEIEVVDRHDNVQNSIEKQFRVVRGEIVAADVRRVFETLAPLFDGPIVLRVSAHDSDRAMHYGKVAFRVARWPLSVTLEAPPSNPGLPVFDVEVGISLPGGYAVQRVSDAQGRFEIRAFPEGVLDLECEVVYKGNYYYGQGTVDVTGPASVTLVLRSIDDIKNGVAPFRVDKGNGATRSR